MRNLKKLLAVVLVVAVMLSAMATVAFADTATVPADAQTCATIGMLQGAGNGVDAAYCATQPTRVQVAMIVLRLKGLDQEALAFTGTDNFPDVTNNYWKPVTAYLKAHPELGFQGAYGKFDPNAKMDAKSFYKVMLVTLGYTYGTDFTWDNTVSFAASKGLSKALDAKTFTIGTLASATVETLKATLKGSTTTLVADLASKNASFATKAQTAGLYTPVAPVFTVASVKADNLNQFEVVFSEAVDKGTAENTANYTLDNGAGYSSALNAWNLAGDRPSASLQSDNKTVKITLDTDNNNTISNILANQIKATLGVSNVMSADKSKTMTSYSGSFTYVDTVAPTALSVTVLGNKVLQVKFSEDVRNSVTTTAYKLDGASLATYSLSSMSYDSGSNTATLNFANSIPTTVKKLTVSQDNSIVDLAGLKLLSQDVPVTVGTDTTAGTVSSVTVAGDKSFVDLAFSKPLAFVSDIAGDPITIDGMTNIMSDGTTAKSIVNGNLRLQTAGAGTNFGKLITGGAHAVNIKNDGSNSITDAYGVKIAASSVTYSVSQDSTKPTVASVSQTEAAKVEVKFSEGVDTATGLNALNYTIKDANGNGVSITGAAFKTGTTDTVQLSLSGALASGSSSITVAAVKDTSANVMDTYTGTFTAVDKTGPSVVNTRYSGTNLVITFNESVDPIVATTAANYLYKGAALPSGTSLSMVSSSQVKIAFPITTTLAGGDAIDVSSNLCDLAGNKMSGFGYSGTLAILADNLDVSAYDGNADYAHLTDTKTIEFKLNKELTNLDITDFMYNIGAADVALTTATATASFTNGSSSATVKIKFASDIATNDGQNGGHPVQIKIKAAAPYGTQAADGTTFGAGAVILAAQTAADKIAPTLADTNPITTMDADGNGKIDHIQVTFKENMDNAYFSNTSFTVAGYTVASVATNAGAVAAAATDGDRAASDDVLIRVSEVLGAGVVDTAATPAITFNGTMKDANGNAYTLPTSAQVAVDDATPIATAATGAVTAASTAKGIDVTVKTSEGVTAYTVLIANGAPAPTAAQVVAGHDSTDGIALAASHPSIVSNTSTTYTIVAPGASTDYDVYVVFVDAAGNQSTLQSVIKVNSHA